MLYSAAGGVRGVIWNLSFSLHHLSPVGAHTVVWMRDTPGGETKRDQDIWRVAQRRKSCRCWEVKLSPREVSKDTLTTPEGVVRVSKEPPIGTVLPPNT